MNSIKISPSSLSRPRLNFNRPKKPYPLPIRPLPIDRFRPPVGKKQIFLPNFVLTFLNTPTRPANTAAFAVPLWFSKLDLKDYLYNVYNIQTLRIRSYVIQSKIREGGKPSNRMTAVPRQWFRPAAQKKMTVELVTDTTVVGQGPFVWPDRPRDWRNWGGKEYRDAEVRQESLVKRRREEAVGRAWPEGMAEVGKTARRLIGRVRAGEEDRRRLLLRKKKEAEEKVGMEVAADD